jgi:hypothetical protein
MKLFEKKLEVRIQVVANGNVYLIQQRPRHYSGLGKFYKYDSLIELILVGEQWVEGLVRDIGNKEIDKECFKDGKFNVHYNWNDDFKENVWVDIKDIQFVRYELYDINKTLKREKFLTAREYYVSEEVKQEQETD